ncbi:MAG: Unknown protein [uncultured Sulfurovum sp.]|uniref:Uncharacterized protein n=1 Tax=uncultured Sulfurovum sp. TaxID=269237 RepID=A0A6S6U8L8_9BACT|nr:MAG: Unknown protein [uncultured Sulfurovum sp.]
MQLNIHIDDRHLQNQITEYMSSKHIQANDFMVELLEHFFHKEGTVLKYKTKEANEVAKVIDFDLESESSHKLFEDVEDVASYSKELRKNAWK